MKRSLRFDNSVAAKKSPDEPNNPATHVASRRLLHTTVVLLVGEAALTRRPLCLLMFHCAFTVNSFIAIVNAQVTTCLQEPFFFGVVYFSNSLERWGETCTVHLQFCALNSLSLCPLGLKTTCADIQREWSYSSDCRTYLWVLNGFFLGRLFVSLEATQLTCGQDYWIWSYDVRLWLAELQWTCLVLVGWR